jgi:hypothetical protein
MTVLIVAMALVVALLCATVWSAYRRRALGAWNRELEAAFGPGERREIGLHRTL